MAEDVVCVHGTAMDVHCCNCHSGFIFDISHECPSEQSEESETVRLLTAVCRKADEAFQKSGGGTRHWVRDCFLPMLNADGWEIRRPSEVTSLKAQLAALEAQRDAFYMVNNGDEPCAKCREAVK